MNTSNDFSYYVPRVHYTTSPKLLSTNISTGYYQHPNQESSFISPYSYGRRNDFYISPTFTSGDCFYPTRCESNNNSNVNNTNNSKVSPIRERSNSPKPNINQQQVGRQSIQSDLKSYIQSDTKSQNQSQNLYQQYKSGQSKSPIKNVNNQFLSPFQLKQFQEQKHSQNNIIPTQPPSPKIASRTPSKKSEINTPARSQRENFLNSNNNMNLKRLSNNNTNNSHKNESHSTNTKRSDVTQEICTKCFNHEIIDHKNRDLQYQKEQQKILLQQNLENEQAIIQREALELLRKRENERQLIRDGFNAHMDRQNQMQKQREQLRGQQRNLAQETVQLAQEQQMLQKQDGMQKRIQFLREIEEQIKQKEILRAQGQGNYLLTGLEIGMENKNMGQQAEQKRQELIEIKQQNKRVLDEKMKAQEQQRVRDKEYLEWAKQQDYQDKMKEVIEKQEQEHKNKILKDGLNSQLQIKNQRIKQQKQQDQEAEKYLKLYADLSEPVKQINFENCGACHQQFPKEHLSKFKKPKKKI